MKITFLGHSCFLLEEGNHGVLIDPFLSENPMAGAKATDIRPTAILVTHGHGDHVGDTVAIAKRTGAVVYGTVEMMRALGEGIKTISAQIGGSIDTDFGEIQLVPAVHESGVPGGLACGFVVDIGGKKVYHAGDTALTRDMELLADQNIDVALLPIGGHYTMEPEDAVKAVEFIDPNAVIPMHYNTFPLIRQDPAGFKAAVEEKLGIPVYVLGSGESIEV